MPVSTSVHISHCLNLIIRLNPKSVLDVGCGFGLWGFLCREYLDVAVGRVQPSEWQVRIDGLELFEPYIQAHHRALYSGIRVADIRDALPGLDHYDLIVAGDVIEHLDKSEGRSVLDGLYEKADKALLVNIPLGEGWDHPEQYGNPGELHRSKWYPEDFDEWPSIEQPFHFAHGDYGVFFCAKEREQQLDALQNAAARCHELGQTEREERLLAKVLEIDPAQTDVAAFVVNALLERGEYERGISVLERTVQAAPDYHFGYVALGKLLRARHRGQEAGVYLDRLLAFEDVPSELRDEAQRLLEQLG